MIIVIPARGGSKRLPHKNIHPLLEKPLLAYTLQAVADAALDIPAFVSTDDDAIAKVASGFKGIEVVPRPPEISGDTASTESVLLHVLDTYKSGKPEWVMTLPPTSPFRSAATIRRFVDEVRANPDAQDCLMSTTENRGDFWRLQQDGTIARLFPNAPRRQQEREPLFEENSAIYLTKVQVLRDTGVILGRRVRGIPISAVEGFDVNTADDLKMAESIAGTMRG
jgi:CMP-N-acetylneuraminic acid synthetase